MKRIGQIFNKRRYNSLRLIFSLLAVFFLFGAVFACTSAEAAVTLSPRYDTVTKTIDASRENYVLFGKFDHRLKTFQGDKEDSPTPILWRVMELANHSENKSGAILLSHYLLESMAYQSIAREGDIKQNQWDGSEVQKWLNDTFFNGFSENEKSAVLNYPYPNGEPMYGITDRMTLPSSWVVDDTASWQKREFTGELAKWFGANDTTYDGRFFWHGVNSMARRAHFKEAQFEYDSTERGSTYWTRSAHSDTARAWYANGDGVLDKATVDQPGGPVRPAFFLNLESVIFKSGSDVSKGDTDAGKGSNPYILYLEKVDKDPASASANGSELTIKFAAADNVVHAYTNVLSETGLAAPFAVTADGGAVSVTSAAVDSTTGTITLRLSRAIGSDETVTVSYTNKNTHTDGLAFASDTVANRLALNTFTGFSATNYTAIDFIPDALSITGTTGTAITEKTIQITAVSPQTLVSVNFSGKPAWMTVKGDTTAGTITISGEQPTAGSGSFQIGAKDSAGQTTPMDVTFAIVSPPPPPPPSDPLTSPTITTQPSAATVYAGATATFTTAATGNPTPTYQWQSSTDGTTWTDIADATAATLTLQNLTLAQSGNKYRCVATNTQGTATSDAAALTVSEVPVAPTIGRQPSGTTVRAGETAKFSITATGIPTPTYQWQESADDGTTWSDIAGAASADLTLQSATLAQSGTQYRCTAANSEGSKASSAAMLTVWEITAVIATPTSFASSGGIGEVEIAGTNLPTGLTVAAFEGTAPTTITGTTTGDESSRKATLSYPPNASITEDKVYTIKASLGGTDYIDTPTATVTVNSAANDEPTEREFFTILEAECEIRYVRNADGTYRVEVLIPVLAGSSPSLIETITATLTGRGYTDITYSFVDEEGVETPIVSAAARGAISAPYLKISFTAPDGTVLDEGVLVKLDYTLADETTGDTVDYVQIFPDGGLKFSAIEQTDTTPPTGGSSGCATGAGIFALAALGITLLRRRW